LKYARWIGSYWSIEVVPDANAYYSSLKLDSAGAPHIASSWSTSDPWSCVYGYVDYSVYKNGQWQVQQLENGEFLISNGVSHAQDNSGNPHFVYAKYRPNHCSDPYREVIYTSFSGGNWEKEKIGDGISPSFALDSRGNAHVSYYDRVMQRLVYAFGERQSAVTPTVTPTPTTTPQKPWTFILYLAADNNLYPVLNRAIQNLEAQPVNPNVNIVVLFDGDRANDSWRFLVQPGGNYTLGINKWYMGELNMGSPQTLADFILWAEQNYSAQNYYLSIANHGRGTTG
jgi:hypothetical protein